MSAIKAVRNLGLGLWVGGTAAIDFVDAPARFKTPGLDRNAITAVGRSVFRAWSRYELGIATVTAATALLAARGEGNGKRTATLVTPMWALSVVQFTVLQPRMRAAAEGLDFVNRDPNEPRYAAHRKIHGAYMAADGIKFLLGLAANIAATSNEQ
ncbi:MAG TPA: DUF4149 domain-containing protein [Thermomicrobiales bacterium]|jgi:uncharacterized membrane protein